VRHFQGNWKNDTGNNILLGAGARPRPSRNVLILYSFWLLRPCILLKKKVIAVMNKNLQGGSREKY
jgi:hypothetical protein